MSYVSFLFTHGRLIGFGFALTFFGAFGQTFFIAMFSDPLRTAYGLSQFDFGLTYSLATLTSAVLFVRVGALIDQVSLRHFTLAVLAGLSAAAALMAFAPPVSVAVLFAAILLLRLCGQGLMGHVAMTTMGRTFTRYRGRAVSLAGIGHSAGEAVMPLLAVSLIAAVGWRGTWGIILGVLSLAVAPLFLWLLRSYREGQVLDQEAPSDGETGESVPVSHGQSGVLSQRVSRVRDWTRAEVIRDPRFYILLPFVLAPGFINTAVFFAQTHIVAVKDWTPAGFAAGLSVFAATTVASALVTGGLVDRFTALRSCPFTLVPLGLAMLALAGVGGENGVFLVLGLAGLSQGAFGTMAGALWAEIYGTRHLGAIRSLMTALMVFSTALSPVLMGALIDRGVAIEGIALSFAAFVGLASLLVPLAWIRATSSPDPR